MSVVFAKSMRRRTEARGSLRVGARIGAVIVALAVMGGGALWLAGDASTEVSPAASE